MGEFVGLALRAKGACPIEVELVPDALAASRDAAKRAPALVMAGLCLWGLLGASAVYVNKADEAVNKKSIRSRVNKTSFSGFSSSIASLNSQLDELKTRSGQLEEAVNDRSYWGRKFLI